VPFAGLPVSDVIGIGKPLGKHPQEARPRAVHADEIRMVLCKHTAQFRLDFGLRRPGNGLCRPTKDSPRKSGALTDDPQCLRSDLDLAVPFQTTVPHRSYSPASSTVTCTMSPGASP
jgi:hypothetical protein